MVFCPYCGEELPEGSEYCGVCGKAIPGAGNVPVRPEYSPAEDSFAAVNKPVAVAVRAEPQKDDLGLSIAALALGLIPLTSPAGLILALISFSKTRKNAGGRPYTGKNRIARILSIVAIPVSARSLIILLIYAVYLVFYILMLAGIIASSFSGSYGIGPQPAVIAPLFMR